jgi:hypothetical protein
MKQITAILALIFLSSCSPYTKEYKDQFIGDCLISGNPRYKCMYLWESLKSECQSEKSASAAMVGGLIGGSIGAGSK